MTPRGGKAPTGAQACAAGTAPPPPSAPPAAAAVRPGCAGGALLAKIASYLKKTLLTSMFVMPCGAVQSREKMSLSVKNTELWALKVSIARGGLTTFCSARG